MKEDAGSVENGDDWNTIATVNLDKLRTAQVNNSKLKLLIDAPSSNTTLPHTHPGLKKCLLVDGLLCQPFHGLGCTTTHKLSFLLA